MQCGKYNAKQTYFADEYISLYAAEQGFMLFSHVLNHGSNYGNCMVDYSDAMRTLSPM
jgi:hypothetical protein